MGRSFKGSCAASSFGIKVVTPSRRDFGQQPVLSAVLRTTASSVQGLQAMRGRARSSETRQLSGPGLVRIFIPLTAASRDSPVRGGRFGATAVGARGAT
eukprot:6457823-Amphidinium_carterae.1